MQKKIFRNFVKNKLQGFQIALNISDKSLPLHARSAKKIAVIGGGIAGISAASSLGERSFEVELFEKEAVLGGKASSLQFESNGETLRAGHGLIGIYRQYLNLRRFLKKIGAAKHLMPVSDYTILFDAKSKFEFRALDKTPGYNMLPWQKQGLWKWRDVFNFKKPSLLNLMMFDFDSTFKKFDAETLSSFAKRTEMSNKLQMVFNCFARMLFTEPENISMAELIKAFHFYFLSNEHGLQFDVLNDDLQTSFITYCEQFLVAHNVKINYSTPVTSIEKTIQGFLINGKLFDYCIICTSANNTTQLLQQSKGFQAYNNSISQIAAVKCPGRYAILRVWTDRFEHNKQFPSFVFTDRVNCLDGVAFYHKIERESILWSQQHRGGIFELSSFAVPQNLVTDEEIKAQLLKDLFHYFPELEGMEILHQYFQCKDGITNLEVNQYETRPEIKTDIPNLYIAGDWVKMNNCSVLMEAAYTSGALAANYIFETEDMRQNELKSMPVKGVFA